MLRRLFFLLLTLVAIGLGLEFASIIGFVCLMIILYVIRSLY